MIGEPPSYDTRIVGKVITHHAGAPQTVTIPSQTVQVSVAPPAPGGDPIQDVCKACGCVVFDKVIHTNWHEKIDEIYPY